MTLLVTLFIGIMQDYPTFHDYNVALSIIVIIANALFLFFGVGVIVIKFSLKGLLWFKSKFGKSPVYQTLKWNKSKLSTD